MAVLRDAGRADPLGARARSRPTLRASGPALHRPRSRAGQGHVVVRAAMERRGYLPGSPRLSRHRAPASVFGHGDRPHDALPARPVLNRHSVGCTATGPSAAGGRDGRIVPQATPDLRRCPSRGPLRDLAPAGFRDITTPTPSDKTPLPPASALGLRPLPHRMNGQSRGEAVIAT